jgi:serine/threonine-protein kinase
MSEPGAPSTRSTAAELILRLELLWEQGQQPDPDLLLQTAGIIAPPVVAEVLAADQWQRWHAGQRLPVEDYFARHPTLAADLVAALVLIYGEFVVREECGEQPDPEDYLHRFPQWTEELRRQLHVHQAIAAAGATVHEGATSTPGASPAPVALPAVPGFEILGELGRGGMGVVYRARQVSLNRIVALKMILAGGYAGAEERVRFLAEAEAVAAVRHTGIVQIHDFGTHAGLPWFALEWCPDGSLEKKLAGTPLPTAEAARLMEQVARAMHAAHQAGIVHRDLKPGNILLAEDGSPRVTDFGLARRVEGGHGLTQTGVIMGTPGYMPPEQAAGRKEIGPVADVYALGAVLYECLTGRPPFRAATPFETVRQVQEQEPVSPRQLNPGVPRDLETICLKCLSKEPARRYGSAGLLADDLRRFAHGEPILARRVGAVERAVNQVRRRPAAAGLLAAVGLLVLVAGVAGWQVLRQRADARLRQEQTDREVRGVLQRAGELLEEGWLAHEEVQLKEAKAEGDRALDIARRGGASAAVQQQAEEFRAEAVDRLARAEKNRTLMVALLDISAPQEIRTVLRDGAGGMSALLPSLDEQYAAAFRSWGLEIAGSAEAEVAARLGQEPAVVVQEVIAGLDGWMLERKQQKRPEAEWGPLFRLAERLDGSAQRRQLRALLVEEPVPAAECVAGLVGVGSPWQALWEARYGSRWRQVQQLRSRMDAGKEAVRTVTLLARASLAVGDAAGAEQVLRQALVRRPKEVVLLDGLGQLLEKQGPSRLGEAIGCYRAARAVNDRLGVALGQALCQAGQWAEGEAVLSDLVRRQPDNPATHFYLGWALAAQRKRDEAIQEWRRTIELDPRLAAVHYNLGMALHGRRKVEEAIQHYRQVLQLEPRFSQAQYIHYNLGKILEAREEMKAALHHYRQAIQLDPGFAQAHNNLGLVLNATGNVEEALRHYRQALTLDPGIPEAHNNVALILHGQGKIEEAIQHFRQAVTLDPGYAEAHYSLGLILYRQGNLEEAMQHYSQAIRYDPGMARAYDHLGVILYARGEAKEAEQHYRQALRLDPGFAQAHYNLGVVLYARGETEEAIRHYRQALTLDPRHASAHHNLGLALYAKGKVEEAIEHYRQAITLEPGSANAHYNLGNVLKDRGQLAEAIPLYRRAIQLDPGMAEAHCNLGIVLLNQGQFRQALESLRRGHQLGMKRPRWPYPSAQWVEGCQRLADLDARLPDFLEGKARPADAAERLALARLCQQYKQLHAASARFYAEAFADQPSLAQDLRAGHRYDAACAAALAAAGQGKDAGQLDDQQRAALRQQALDWLSADLGAWAKMVDKGSPPERLRVQRTLQHWQKDPDLAGLRDEEPLSRLPEAQRRQWQKLWAEVAALRDKAGGAR